MRYLKFQSDAIFSGFSLLGGDQVIITDEKGIIRDIIPEREAGPDVQKLEGILLPGLINCHCHLELSHLRQQIPEKTGLVNFVLAVMRLRNFPREQVEDAIRKGEEEMLQNGIVGVGDISNEAITVSQKSKANLCYYNFIEVSGFIPEFANQRFDKIQEVYAQFLKLKTQQSAIVPHAPYSVSKELFGRINQHSAGKIISIHNQESPEENRFFAGDKSEFFRLYEALGMDLSFFSPTGKHSLPSFLPLLDKPARQLLIHNTFTTEEDITAALVQASGLGQELFFCLCPRANWYIEQAVPPVALLRQSACRITLGTDSLASNNSLSILEEIKFLHANFPEVPVQEIFGWATLNGAQALGMDATLGTIEKGKQPGIVCISSDLNSIRRLI